MNCTSLICYGSDETRVEYIKEGILDAYSVHGPKQRSPPIHDEKMASGNSSPEPDDVTGAGVSYVRNQQDSFLSVILETRKPNSPRHIIYTLWFFLKCWK